MATAVIETGGRIKEVHIEGLVSLITGISLLFLYCLYRRCIIIVVSVCVVLFI
jgi:hypothetical protein